MSGEKTYLPDGPVKVARQYLTKILADYSDDEVPMSKEKALKEFDAFVADFPEISDLILDRGILRLPFIYGMLQEVLDSVISASTDSKKDVEPFILAGRLVAAISPRRAEVLLDEAINARIDPENLN